MDISFHESDDRLELYALDRLSDSELIKTEEHLLKCDFCRDRLDQNAGFAHAMRAVLKGERKKSSLPEVFGNSGWLRWLKPQFAFAGLLAFALFAVVFFRTGNATIAPLATIQLTALRGTEVHGVHVTRELDLSFTDAASGAGAPMVEVVDGGGIPIWHGQPEIAAGAAKARIRMVLAPGDYFARFYDRPGHLLHEYAFGVLK